ncbi:MAG TPA: ECF-type sigma factor [Pseudonocardiaceae bacterium]
MRRPPIDAVRRFELEVIEDAPANRRVRELLVLDGLNALEVVITQRIAEVVAVCREQGASWSEIGATLNVSKQAAHERFGHRRSRAW